MYAYIIGTVTRSRCQAMMCNAMNVAASAGFLRATARNASRILAIVEVSVRSSVTPLSPVKTMQDRITKSLLQAATRTLH